MTSASTTGERRETRVARVEALLAERDDFLSSRQIVEALDLAPQLIAACLHHLQKHRVIDAVLVHDEPFWFLTGEDTRKKKLAKARKPYTRVDANGRRGAAKKRKLYVPRPENAG